MVLTLSQRRRKMKNDQTECRICGKEFKYLGAHLSKHKITAKIYKEKFGITFNLPLISDEVRNKKVEAWYKDKEKYLKNLVNEDSKKYHFKKGHRPTVRDIKMNIDTWTKQLHKINAREERECPFCNKVYKHVESHIYTKHGYVKIGV